MEIRAIRRAISVVTIRADADLDGAEVGGPVSVGLVAVERVGAEGAAVQRVEAVGGEAVGG